MAGTIKRSTANFALAIPWFDTPGWGAAFERNMDIIDAVLSTAGVVNNIVGQWANNTTYAVDDRVVDPTNDTVWQCAVGHTSAVSGTFAADRAANPTYWDAVSQSVVVRGAFVHGAEYFIGDFVYDESEYLGGIVIDAFTGDTNLRNNINDIGIIFDLKDEMTTLATKIGGTTGSVDNRLLRSDGTGTKTAQATGITVDDANNITGVNALTIAHATQAQLILAIATNTRAFFAYNESSSVAILDSDGNISFRPANVEKILIDTDGLLRLTQGQILFPSTQVPSSNPNVLDDYEEGTFTPVVEGITTPGAGTYSAQQGYYTKIGNVVAFSIILQWSAHTGTGLVRITGLPFTQATAYSHPVTVVSSNYTLTANNIMGAMIDGSSSNITLIQMAIGGSSITTATLDTAATLYLSGTYRAV